MNVKKYDCETMFDAPTPYGIMVESKEGSYVSESDYEELKQLALDLLAASDDPKTVQARSKLTSFLFFRDTINQVRKEQKEQTEQEDIITVEIQFKEFGGDEISADNLYNNPAYDDSFKFQVKHSDEIYTGNLGWEQGRGNNYRFYVGCDGSDKWFSPSEVTHVEVK